MEDALKDHPGVDDVFVTGAPSKQWGETVVAYVALKDPNVTEGDLDEFCKAHPRLARYQWPRHYRFVVESELPFGPSGKKLHHVIRERARNDFPEGA